MWFLVPIAAARPFSLDDFDQVRDVSEPTSTPASDVVVYVVSRVDVAADEVRSSLSVAAPTGVRALTHGDADHTPALSRDGRTVAFLRPDDDGVDQIFLLPMDGGEARQLTTDPGGVVDLDWSPDGLRLAVIVADDEPDDEAPAPIVVDRFHFLEDGAGFLTDVHHHLGVVDARTGEVTRLVTGSTDEASPAFSPDGRRIAYVGRRGPDPDREDIDVWVIEARAGAEPTLATTNPTHDNDPEVGGRPVWSPDGRTLAVVQQGAADKAYFAGQHLALVPADGSGPARELVPGLDRNSWGPVFSKDGKTVSFVLEDDGRVSLAEASVATGRHRVLTPDAAVVTSAHATSRGLVVLAEDGTHPPELHALAKGALRPLTHENDAWLAEVELAPTTPITFPSTDGVEVHGFVVTPPGEGPHPAFLRLHGGPVYQHDAGFRAESQWLAAQGYLVVLPNPRGSSGRGEAFSLEIFAAWGEEDTADVLAAADAVVARGLAAKDRLAVGGWSYGGILADQVIARDGRFRAAISGAGIADVFAGYGTDQYVRDYEAELGRPWERPDAWTRVSYPFLHAGQIHTPTLFLHGQDDVNVPLHGSLQLYQALRSLGVPTELVIYPDEPHGIGRPSFVKDKARRYADWLDDHTAAP